MLLLLLLLDNQLQQPRPLPALTSGSSVSSCTPNSALSVPLIISDSGEMSTGDTMVASAHTMSTDSEANTTAST